MATKAGYLEIPIEVFVKYTEKGDCIPYKLIYTDRLFVIDKVLDESPPYPAKVYGYAPRVFTCLIAGRKRQLYFYAHESKWVLLKPSFPAAFDG